MTADRVLDGAVLVDRQLQRNMAGRLEHTTPKAEKVRTVRLPSAVRLEVRRHLEHHQGAGLLFRGGRSDGEGMRKDAFYVQAWRPALVDAGLARNRFRFHSLRHWCASSMLAEGLPVTGGGGPHRRHRRDLVVGVLALAAGCRRRARRGA